MAKIVYVLCSLTSVGCAALLLRSYFASRRPLLFWSGTAFGAFAVGNSLLFLDLVLLPGTDLLLLRNGVTLAGIALLLYGLICETN